MALLNSGLNCFHCHQLTYENEAARLSRLFKAEPDLSLAAIELRMMAKHTALNMLVRWYRKNPRSQHPSGPASWAMPFSASPAKASMAACAATTGQVEMDKAARSVAGSDH